MARKPEKPASKPASGGVNSLEIGLRLARVLAAPGAPQALKDIAAAAGMPAAKAHRYLVSLIRAGLAEQDAGSSRYRLGPLALDLGLAALNGLDVGKFGAETLTALHAQIDETVLLAIWGNQGPVVVRWEECSRPVATNVRTGWVMPLVNSATGRLFAAYLPAATTATLLKAELARQPRHPHHPRDRATHAARFAARLDSIRRSGLSLVEGDLQPGVAAVAAPVFGQEGAMVAAIAALGPHGAFDLSAKGLIVNAVKQSALSLSKRLGHAIPPNPKRRTP